ncbi:aminopeptidase P family protein [Acetobacter sp. AN02]|uniref:aminopeptidase P family protein n=1 Tax=Acetobacter sp. AN02 TaxID=2894186 RepID=UPI002434268A|nr:aminopeptidase P family protein [Acetobacter sp. AN02]MDG6093878.1 aminopeptidase P family protein [Acetobacter sp. AN02]
MPDPSPEARLKHLRDIASDAGTDGLIIPRSDEYLNEYVPACAERLAWVTGFTGSAGLAIILPDRACVFSDGRYITQMSEEVDPALWEQRHIITAPPSEWLKEAAPQNARVGYDPRVISRDALRQIGTSGVTLVPLDFNPADRAWTGRPAPSVAPALIHPEHYAGESAASKRDRLAASLRDSGYDAAILSDPTSVAWLLNIRGTDIPCTPVCLCTAILFANAKLSLFIAPEKITPDVKKWLGNDVTILSQDRQEKALKALHGKTVLTDPAGTPLWYAQKLQAAGAHVADGQDPCVMPRATKNRTEQTGARIAHLRDAAAVCRFLYWLESNAATTTEMQAAEQLGRFRQENEEYREESFTAISAAGPHGAIMHYHVSQETDRLIGSDTLYLIDSGGQYPEGTTDITRTVWTGPSDPPRHMQEAWTRVLIGNLVLGATRFPEGTTGGNLDCLARHALWQAGQDFDHGTGHGVGSFLSVHEGPARIAKTSSVPLVAGMILSNEPGFYEPGAFGIRLETLVLVSPSDAGTAQRHFLEFETLTLVPFDLRLVLPELMSTHELDLLDAYHARILREVGPLLPAAERTWLAHGCRPINRK